MRIYQTDFSSKIKDYGCLFMSLLNMVVKETGTKIRKIDVQNLYEILIKQPCMNTNCYIKDHEAVLYIMLDYFGHGDKLVKYTGAKYLESDDSWGSNLGDYVLFQVKTPSYSHFRSMDYDPWRPTLPYNTILSVRYYTIR